MKFRLIIALAFSVVVTAVKAQVQPEKEDGLALDVVDEIELEIELDSAERLYENEIKVPVRETTVRKQEFFVNSYDLPLSDLEPKIKIYTIKPKPLKPLYGNFVRLGYGNYSSPLAELYFNSKRSKTLMWGVNLLHKSSGKGPIDGKNSAYGNTDVMAYAKMFRDKSIIDVNVDYGIDVYHFYGYDEGIQVEDREKIRQTFNRYKASVGLASNNEEKVQYDVDLGVSGVSDNYNAKENEVFLESKNSYSLENQKSIIADVDFSSINQKDSLIDDKRIYAKVHPKLRKTGEKLVYELGVNLAYENDTLKGNGGVHVYPSFHAEYLIEEVKGINLYAGFGGGILKQTYQKHSEENPYLNSNVNVFHSNEALNLYAGIEGDVLPDLAANISGTYSSINNWWFYMNSPVDESRFDIVYAKNTTVLDLAFHLNYVPSKKYGVGLKSNYYNYQVDFEGAIENQAYHKPQLENLLYAEYYFKERVKLRADIYYISGIKAYDFTKNEVVSLKSIVDLGIGAEYYFNSRATAFVDLNNLISKSYQRYYRYDSQAFNLMIGLTYSF